MNIRTVEGKEFAVVLASVSPQRREILEELGIAFRVIEPQADEINLPDALETVAANAKLKALAVVSACRQDDVILAADTVLCVNGHVRGKPASPEEAVRYLMELSGGKAVAWTGVAAFSPDAGRGVVRVERAEVCFSVFSAEAAAWYVGTGEPLSRAGALGVSRLGEVFVKSIHGSHSCVAGLPKRATLLACSDASALGRYRLDLSQMVCNLLQWPWIEPPQSFSSDGNWLDPVSKSV